MSLRESSRRPLRRAIAMLRSLQQGDATRTELIRSVCEQLGDSAYGDVPEDSFLRDVNLLREAGITLIYSPKERTWHLDFSEHPLLNLPLTREDGQLLGIIRYTFQDTPYQAVVSDLIERLIRVAPEPAREATAALPP